MPRIRGIEQSARKQLKIDCQLEARKEPNVQEPAVSVEGTGCDGTEQSGT